MDDTKKRKSTDDADTYGQGGMAENENKSDDKGMEYSDVDRGSKGGQADTGLPSDDEDM